VCFFVSNSLHSLRSLSVAVMVASFNAGMLAYARRLSQVIITHVVPIVAAILSPHLAKKKSIVLALLSQDDVPSECNNSEVPNAAGWPDGIE
jgi:hypothetical protein